MDARSSSIHRIGTIVGGKYRLLRVIGSGGMGEVYEAEHRHTLRRVAVKLVHPWLIAVYPGGEDRFFREAQVAAKVRHPAIVDVLDAGREDEGTLYLVFELLYGENLEVALQHERILPRDLVRICVRVLDALSAIHAHGVVHRDIKPANIFLAKSSYGAVRVKLLDFGIAKPMENTRWGLTERGAVVGTVDYMSPEQALGEELDGRSDLWATSAVLFRGLAGRPPFVASNPNRVIVRLVTTDPPLIARLRPDLPQDVSEVIDRALLRDRNARWSTAEDMAQALALCEHEALASVALPSGPHFEHSTDGTQPDLEPIVHKFDIDADDQHPDGQHPDDQHADDHQRAGAGAHPFPGPPREDEARPVRRSVDIQATRSDDIRPPLGSEGRDDDDDGDGDGDGDGAFDGSRSAAPAVYRQVVWPTREGTTTGTPFDDAS
ncbi:MAG: serine/threonine protein kinase [Deltaproteobacteria bacterium]|nr:serine/threonine protein kinase [Deltaproteobacteria bacterium]